MREFVIEPKRDPQQEYTIHLFEFCNLRCAFCWQDHENLVGIDTVLEKLEPIEKFLQKETRKKVVFNIMGGEIFADKIYTEKLNDAYFQLAQGIKDLAIQYNVEASINWVSNLVTDKTDQIFDLLKKVKGIGVKTQLVTSYDPAGRFNKNDFVIFQRNLETFKDEVEGVGILLTRANIARWLGNNDWFLDKLYNDGFYIYADYYMPDKHAKHSMPTDTDLFEVFKHFINKYPKIDPINSWIENDFNYATCRTSKLVLQDNTMCLCGNLVQDIQDSSQYSSPIKPMDNSIIENKFIEKYDCISCEYYRRCGLGCFMNRDYKFRDELDECVYKLTHRYIEDVRLHVPFESSTNIIATSK
jgi:sulfatase maturation enzyme AslB (radical SAM superfamily)